MKKGEERQVRVRAQFYSQYYLDSLAVLFIRQERVKNIGQRGSEGLIILGTIYMIFYKKEVGRAEL